MASAAPALSPIATLLDTRDCLWENPASLPVTERLTAGRLELKTGVALIEFDGGARLALQCPASLELLEYKTAWLHRGNATMRCENGTYTFSLLTPTSNVIDLGTEFGIAV
jgi:hypothetical protein